MCHLCSQGRAVVPSDLPTGSKMKLFQILRQLQQSRKPNTGPSELVALGDHRRHTPMKLVLLGEADSQPYRGRSALPLPPGSWVSKLKGPTHIYVDILGFRERLHESQLQVTKSNLKWPAVVSAG